MGSEMCIRDSIKTMNTWVVVVNIILGVVAAFAAYKLGKFPVSKK